VKRMNESILMGNLSLAAKRSSTRDYRIGPRIFSISRYTRTRS
jgi:hypothetical protein